MSISTVLELKERPDLESDKVMTMQFVTFRVRGTSLNNEMQLQSN